MKYNIYNKGFQTKKEAYFYTRNILINNRYKTFTEGEIFNYCMGMVEIHHNKEEKIGNGIISFYIGDDAFKNIALFINQTDKQNIGFSWVQVCKFKPPTNREDYISSLRQSINNQIFEFRKNTNLICDFCKSRNNIHIDHIYLFKHIVKDFEDEFNFEIPKLYGKEYDTNKTMFLEEDIDIRNAFEKFHKEKAELRPLCSKCNLGRNK